MSARSGRWVICPCCIGEGTVDTLGVVNPRDFDADDWEFYQEGGYDATCSHCSGAGKVLADAAPPIVRVGSDGQNVVYADADDASEHFLRMAEGWA